MTIENLPENSPFNTQEWIEFLREEAEIRGLNYSSFVEFLGNSQNKEYQSLQEKFIKKYREKHG